MLTWAFPVMLARNTATTKLAFVIFIFLLPVTIMSQAQNSDSDSGSELDALLKFKDALTNGSLLTNWNPSTLPCKGNTANWFGVLCYNGFIWGLQLENMGLTGTLNTDPLVPLKYLRTLSFMNNDFSGPLPSIKKLSSLKSLYLTNNWLSGQIPDDAFAGMGSLKKLLLANNALRGKIPSSLATLPKLLEVRLNGNQFQGQIPDFNKNLKLASFENNDLEGPIPKSLQKMDPGSFAGNKDLCGPPLSSCSPRSSSRPSLQPDPTKKNGGSFFTISIILIVIGIILMIIAIVICIFHMRKQKCLSDCASISDERINSYDQTSAQKAPEVVVAQARRGGATEHKLSFVRDDIRKFDLQDLMRASAEVLGSGTFGASYKAVITSGQMLVVKRYKQMNNAGKEEFHEHMRRLGRLRHPNLLPLVAYYYRREEKLLVTEFMQNSSLASHLHGNRTLDQPGLDWTTRLKIIKGVAKGLSYLYTELPTLTIPDGHLKSSNVVLDESFEPLLTDYALRPVMNSDHARNLMIAYKSPEYSKTGQITKKTDVWSLGILILELLTGKFPENYITQGYDTNISLVTCVSEMVKEKKTNEVFDKEMTGKQNCKSEMLNLLKIGLSCCEEDEERRIEMRDAVEKIDGIREGEFDDEFSSSTSERNTSASRFTDDDFGFAMDR